MARFLARECPRRKGYVGIIVREPGRNVPLQAVNGHCLRCSYRMAWIVIRGRRRKQRLDHISGDPNELRPHGERTVAASSHTA